MPRARSTGTNRKRRASFLYQNRPLVNLSVSDSAPWVGQTVTFTISDLYVGLLDSTDINSDFGDGSLQQPHQSVQHTFSAAGTYDVTVQWRGTLGFKTHTFPSFLTVYPALSGSYTVSTATPDAGQTITLTLTLAGQSSWSINWGDGSSNSTGTTGTTATHAYSSEGTYAPVLTVTNGGGSKTFTMASPYIVVTSTGLNAFFAGKSGRIFRPDAGKVYQETGANTTAAANADPCGRMLEANGESDVFAATADGNRPTLNVSGGRRWLGFDGTNDTMEWGGTLASSHTILLVNRGEVGGFSNWGGYTTGSGSSGNAFIPYYGNISYSYRSIGTYDQITSGGNSPFPGNSTDYVIAIVYDATGNAHTVYKNGTAVLSYSGSGVDGAATTVKLARFVADGIYGAQRIYAFGYIPSALNSTDIGTMSTLADSELLGGGGGGGTPPTASFTSSAGSTFNEGTTVTFTNTSSPSGTSHSWKLNGSEQATTLNWTHTFSSPGTYTIDLRETGSGGSDDSDTLTVTVQAIPGVYLYLDHDPYIPNFNRDSYITTETTGAGDWNDASKWTNGVPTTDSWARVKHAISYNVNSSTATTAVCVQTGGTLAFRTDINTKLVAQHVYVGPGGTMTMGTTGTPVEAGKTARLVIRDVAIDHSFDANEYGNGLIVYNGTFSAVGATAKSWHARVATEALAGATTLTLATTPTNWKSGDTIVVDDTHVVIYGRNGGTAYSPEYDVRTLTADVTTTTASLSSALTYNHYCGRNGDGTIDRWQSIFNLTRPEVVIESENPTGTRGHMIFMDDANIWVENITVSEMGRTRITALDSTTRDSGGTVTHQGTNQIGRYPLHFHFCGTGTVQSNGFMGTVKGCVFTAPVGGVAADGIKWGIVVHHTPKILVQNNVVYCVGGSGIVAEDGSEKDTLFDANRVSRIIGYNGFDGLAGRADQRFGAILDAAGEGTGIWCRGALTKVTNNIVSGCASYGYILFQQYLGTIPQPAVIGDPRSDWVSVNMHLQPITLFSDNEAYSVSSGITIWWLGCESTAVRAVTGRSYVTNLTVWHHSLNGWFGYECNKVTLDGLIVRGDLALMDAGFSSGVAANDYMAVDFIVDNANVQNTKYGTSLSTLARTPLQNDPDTTPGISEIKNSYFRCDIGTLATTLWTSSYRADYCAPRHQKLTNNVFALPASGGTNRAYILMEFLPGRVKNIRLVDKVTVYDHQGVPGDDFQVWLTQQAASYVTPVSIINDGTGGTATDGTLGFAGASVAGRTNQQNYNAGDYPVGGEIAPSDATTRTYIVGLCKDI